MTDCINFVPLSELKRRGYPTEYLAYWNGRLKLVTIVGIQLMQDKQDYEIIFADGNKIAYIIDETFFFDISDLFKFMQNNFIFDIKRK